MMTGLKWFLDLDRLMKSALALIQRGGDQPDEDVERDESRWMGQSTDIGQVGVLADLPTKVLESLRASPGS